MNSRATMSSGRELDTAYEQLMTEWVVKNPDFDGLDGESIPIEVQVEILGRESLLNHYFPNEYRKPPQPVRGKNPDGNDD